MKLKKRLKRDIVIKASDNDGFIVKVGCAEFSYSDHHVMCRDLAEYLSNPKKYEKAFEPIESSGGAYHGTYGAALGGLGLLGGIGNCMATVKGI